MRPALQRSRELRRLQHTRYRAAAMHAAANGEPMQEDGAAGGAQAGGASADPLDGEEECQEDEDEEDEDADDEDEDGEDGEEEDDDDSDDDDEQYVARGGGENG